MPLRVPCACGRMLVIPEKRAGQVVRCPKCQHRLRVPGSSQEGLEASPDSEDFEDSERRATAAPPPVAESRASSSASPPRPPALPSRSPVPAKTPRPPRPPSPSATSSAPSGPSEKESPASSASSTARPPVPPGLPASLVPQPAARDSGDSPSVATVRGVEHTAERIWTVYYLGLATAALTLFSAAPAVLELVQFYREVESMIVPRWVHFIFLVSCIQLAYTVYLIQLPDWSTVWVMAILLLVLATLYAMLWGVTLLGSADNSLVQFLQLESKLARGRASSWCLIMLSVTGLLSYIVGRVGYRWHAASAT